MEMSDSDDRFFIYENRLASFQGPPAAAKKRTSSASARAPKAPHWPHKSMSPAELARAGFYFEPFPGSADNVVCFLCRKSLDGWEEGDDPLMEHLKHSPNCGWAIMAAIEAGMAEYALMYPMDPRMLEARKATFAGKWPYESKKGFKCKTKQLAESGWKYTPTLEADDMVTCAYCQLGLDGWEAGDKPIDEHYKRAPECPFFTIMSQNPPPPPPKKSGRAKAARSSKASRISIQSVATAISEMPSIADITADHDDSVMTTTSIMTQGAKKAARGRKTAAPKGRKTRAKKDEAIEVHEDELEEIEVPPPPPPKPTRGRKRGSDAMEDSVVTNAEAPAPKRRATRVKGSNAVDASILSTASQDIAPSEPIVAKPAGRKKAAPKTTRKRSQSSARSNASTASLRAHIPDDDEIDRQLQADLERPLTDEEDFAAMSSDLDAQETTAPAPARGRPSKGAKARKTGTQSRKQPGSDYAMFDLIPVEPSDSALEAELEAMKAEMDAKIAKIDHEVELEVESEQQAELQVPKKGRKATGTRKVSKQTKKGKKAAPAPEPIDQPVEDSAGAAAAQEQPQEPAPDAQLSTAPEGPDASAASTLTATVTGQRNKVKRGRGRPSKKSITSQVAAEDPEPEPQMQAAAAAPAHVQADIEPASVRELPSAVNRASGKISRHTPEPAPAPIHHASTPTPARITKPLPAAPESSSRIPRPPATPGRVHATPSAKQATMSPSQSPQSSDAENQPPSSKAAPTTAHKRVMLPPVTATPIQHGSPRRNVVGSLRSLTPWRPVDVDMLFSPREKEESNAEGSNDKANGVDKLLRRGPELTSPEKHMTVEEWIYHNAGQAEQKLKHECEAMVSTFEQQGSRAMRVLEGLVVE